MPCAGCQRTKGDVVKAAIAERLRAETAVTVKWIAERLRMAAPGYVNHRLNQRRKAVRSKHANIKNWHSGLISAASVRFWPH